MEGDGWTHAILVSSAILTYTLIVGISREVKEIKDTVEELRDAISEIDEKVDKDDEDFVP